MIFLESSDGNKHVVKLLMTLGLLQFNTKTHLSHPICQSILNDRVTMTIMEQSNTHRHILYTLAVKVSQYR